MSPDQERRLEEIFSAARDLPPVKRAAFLERTCGGDAELRQQVDSLLTAYAAGGSVPSAEHCSLDAERARVTDSIKLTIGLNA